MKTIIKAEITAMPKDFFSPMPKVKVVYDDNSNETLFEFYPDEISFSTNEFIGLTKEQAINLKFQKDRNYLRD